MTKKGTQRRHGKANYKTTRKIKIRGGSGSSTKSSTTSGKKTTSNPAKNEEPDRCPICLEDLGGDRKMTPCNHAFHDECLNGWVVTGHFNCPVCRAILPGAARPAYPPLVPPVPVRAGVPQILDADIQRVKALAGLNADDNSKNDYIKQILSKIQSRGISINSITNWGILQDQPAGRRRIDYRIEATPWTSRLLQELRTYYLEY